MRKASLLLALAIILATNSVMFGSPQSEISGEEYEVYSVAIQDFFTLSRKVKSVAITDYTIKDFSDLKSMWQTNDYFRQSFSALLPETIDNYAAANGKEHQVKNSFNLQLHYIFLTKSEVESIFKRGTRVSEMEEWEAFYKKFPEIYTIASVSRVGFNSERNQALVYLEFWCRSLCGEGNYIFLNKQDGKWKVFKKDMMWVS